MERRLAINAAPIHLQELIKTYLAITWEKRQIRARGAEASLSGAETTALGAHRKTTERQKSHMKAARMAISDANSK